MSDDYFQDYRQKNTPCFKPMLKPCIEPNGDIRPCCSMNPVGNLTTQRLEEIIASDVYGQGVVKGLIKECPSCSCHYALSLDANIVYQLKDIYYG
jgi:MoaA/NifB/PqqE/SkfB family radical SAM enzyme